MKYTSTRDNSASVQASYAIVKGISQDGGLYVPTEFPQCDYTQFCGMSYEQVAQKVLGLFATDYTDEFLKNACEAVYAGGGFNSKAGYVKHVKDNKYSLELWHGPTSAFKDYALQIMPHLFVQAKKNLNDTSTTKILVATSGDTGTAALAGYKDLQSIRIAVFYPQSGTSEIQRLQMATHGGDNVKVYAVKGNFDDAQTGVKKVFLNADIASELERDNAFLSSANSINLGRLIPQVVYYFYSYAQLVAQNKIKTGEKVNFCVPTGNFGDILAGFYAKQMGLPVNKLICAANKNNVLADFLTTGEYNANRSFYKTSSPSMDILVSSNLERLLYHITGDANTVASWMSELATKGAYTVDKATLDTIKQTFATGYASEEMTSETIKKYADETGYIMDPHTAVAFYVADNEPCCESVTTVVLSTASPYKFPEDVLSALGEKAADDAFECLKALSQKCSEPIPAPLSELKNKQVRFTEVIDTNEIAKIALTL